ncbi:MAG: TrmB family transcriptional regulator [Candidatus Thermoplasmatota archaeon]|nr:TrmB family transcriptional regulator [Candidatus Thermoplasmatota archaeon]
MEINSDQMSRIMNSLKLLGLSSYEAQGFAALVYHGVANADTIAESAKIPRTSAYKVMESLVEKGLARETEGRPKMFKPEDLNVVKNQTEARIKTLFEDLRFLQEVITSKGEPQLVYTIYGNEKVFMKLQEMINLTEHDLYICTPRVREIRTELKKSIENAVKRGVRVVFVTPPNKRVPEHTESFIVDGLIATDVVSDGARALLAGPEMEACGYTDNPALAMHVYQFIQMLIEKRSA